MKADSRLLSICIPTYNGAKYIKKNIDTIISQIQKYNFADVEIVVSDNCSTDSIPEIMKEYKLKYPDIIVYSRNNSNLGYDGNVMKCCEIANGKFIHLFGDDDFYAPDGLKRLHDALEKNPDLSILVLSNYYLRNDNFGEIVSRKHLNETFNFEDKLYISDSDKFIIEIEDRAWPNTNLVFRKDYFFKIPNIRSFYKKDWIHIYILLYLAQKWQNCYLFADKYPIVIDRVGVQAWLNNNDGPRIYYNNLWTYAYANELGYSQKVFNWYRKKLLSEYIKFINFRRSHNFFRNIILCIKYFKYWKDLPEFYFKFIPKFINPIQEIFSVKNEYIKNSKCKILSILGKRWKVKVKRKLRFAHNFNEKDILVIKKENGHFKQFVKGNCYLEMAEAIKTNDKYKILSKDFCKKIIKYRRKKLVPYSVYLCDCYYYQHLTNKINRGKNGKNK